MRNPYILSWLTLAQTVDGFASFSALETTIIIININISGFIFWYSLRFFLKILGFVDSK